MTPAKRLFDICLALALGLVLAPVMAALALLLRLHEGAPVLYSSERMRAPGEPFTLWKFRTMDPGTPEGLATGGDSALHVTPLGRWLRRTRADELPQLWNVLRGDMSLVGPRPPLRRYVELRPALYAEVLACRPGITGLATLRLHGWEERVLRRCRTPEETDAVYLRRCVPRKAQLDLIYRRRRSLCLDILLLWQTLRRVARLRRPRRA